MTAEDFKRTALTLEGAEQGSHMGAVDFRVGGRIFATLASVEQGYGNLMLTPEQQAAFCEDQPEIFLPVHGGWGRMGITHIRLASATPEIMEDALRAAWRIRVAKNLKTRSPKNKPPKKPAKATAKKSSR